MATVTWGTTTTYPKPSTVEERPDFVGGVGVMADGSLSIDAIVTKKRVRLLWQGLTASEANALYGQGITYTTATMDMSNAGGANYGSVVPIPNSAIKNAVATNPVVYDFSVEVRVA